MKIKKVISMVSAVVIAMGAFVSMSVIASADYSEVDGVRTWTFETPAVKRDLTPEKKTTYYYTYKDDISESDKDSYNAALESDTLYIYAKTGSGTNVTHIGEGEYSMTYKDNIVRYKAPSNGTLVVTATTENIKIGDTVSVKDGDVYTTTVNCTEGNVYAAQPASNRQKITKITFTPDEQGFTPVTAQKAGTFTEEEGDAAVAWKADVDAGTAPGAVQWKVTNSDGQTANCAATMPDGNVDGDGNIRLGLILTGTAEEVNGITGVVLEEATN